MNSRIRVAIQRGPKSRAEQVAEGFTRVVNSYGCLLISPVDMDLDCRLRLTNRCTGQTVEGVVVWKGVRQVDGWELGVELITANLEFWGLEL